MIIDAYVRVSTEEQAQHGVSPDAQRERIAAYHNLCLGHPERRFDLGELVIEDVSAKTLERPGLRAILARLDRGKADGLIVAKLDRLTRSLADWSWLIDRYFSEKKGKRLIAVDNEVNTATAGGRLMLNMLVMVAQWERETIAERTRDALRHKIARGERCGKVRYGYTLHPDGKTLLPDVREQAVITIIRGQRSFGTSLRTIAAWLNNQGIPTKERKAPWGPTSVARILARKP